MNMKNKIPLRPSYPWHLFALIVTTVFAIAVSLYCLNAGQFIVFQNLFYFPIIIACVYYLRKGFVFSVLLAFFYFFLVFAYTSNSTIIRETFVRVAIFIMVAGVISFLSLKQKRSEEGQNRVRSWREGVNRILGLVLEPVPFDEKLKRITDGVVETFGADFCRIWIIGKGDLCSAGCIHAEVLEGPHVCRYRDKCLHLKASSGRYTHIDGKAHRRIPFGVYKIGRIASGEEIRFLTNDVQHDPSIHDHEWAKSLGLAANACYRLRPTDGETLGVLVLFAKFEISPDMDAILEGLSRAIALVIQKDIAERALEEAFNKRKELEFIVNHSPAVVWLWKAEENQPVEFVSENVNQFGYMADDFTTGRIPFSSILHPDDLPRVGAEIEQYTHEGRTEFTQEYRLITQSGDIRWIDDRTWVRRGTDRSVTHYQGIIVDITDRKRVEGALRESEERMRAITDSAKDAIIMMDPQGSISFWNPAAEEILGYRSDEAIGKILHHLLAPERYHESYHTAFPAFLRTGSGNAVGKTLELFARRKDGREIEIALSLSAVSHHGEWYAVGIIRDITERKLAEEARYNHKKLQGVLEMAGAVCHEMNQPMQIISGCSEMLLMKISENDPIHTKLDTIIKQIHRMGTITRKLMTIKDYETQDYAGFSRIIDINKSSGTDTE